jgi:tRNA (guanine-N7-)-methyltransferase
MNSKPAPDERDSAAVPVPAHPPSNLYGRHRGRKLRAHQADLMASLLPELRLDLSRRIEDPCSLFGSLVPSKVRLEIGFGGGEHLIGEALDHPHIGFLGCEPFVNGIAKTLAAIAENNLTNIRLHPGDARELIAALPERSIERVELLYPDPWPKRRQRKRRFLSDETLQALARILPEGEQLRFATDIDDYSGWALAHVARSDAFAWQAETAQDWLQAWDGWSSTRYEARAIREARVPVYLTFVRRAGRRHGGEDTDPGSALPARSLEP